MDIFIKLKVLTRVRESTQQPKSYPSKSAQKKKKEKNRICPSNLSFFLIRRYYSLTTCAPRNPFGRSICSFGICRPYGAIRPSGLFFLPTFLPFSPLYYYYTTIILLFLYSLLLLPFVTIFLSFFFNFSFTFYPYFIFIFRSAFRTTTPIILLFTKYLLSIYLVFK